jgi:hypothetical protein
MIQQRNQSRRYTASVRTAGMCLLLYTVTAAIVMGDPVSGSAQSGNTTTLQIPPFSADQIHIMGNKTKAMKVHANQNAMRMEGEEKGKRSIVIMRFDRKVMWSLLPDQKMYVELPWASQGEWTSYMQQANMQRQSLGDEQVGAYHCEKSRVQVTLQGKVYTSFQWTAKELNGFVVKTQDEKGQWSNEYQNVQLGPQDPALFEVPADYKKLSLGGMMQNR